MRRGGAIRLAAAMALAVLAGACAQRSDLFVQQVLEYGIGELTRGEAEPTPLPSREQLNEFPYPMIAITRSDSKATGIVVAVTANSDGYATYQDRTRRSVILHGGLLSGTQGFGYDLSAVKTQRDDPVVHQTVPSKWPGTLIRNYQFSLGSADDFQITVTCTVRQVVREQIVIFEIGYDVVRMQEDCMNDRRTFTNVYWVDPESGFIWRSTQWIGPRVTPLTVEVIRPLGSAASAG